MAFTHSLIGLRTVIFLCECFSVIVNIFTSWSYIYTYICVFIYYIYISYICVLSNTCILKYYSMFLEDIEYSQLWKIRKNPVFFFPSQTTGLFTLTITSEIFLTPPYPDLLKTKMGLHCINLFLPTFQPQNKHTHTHTLSLSLSNMHTDAHTYSYPRKMN